MRRIKKIILNPLSILLPWFLFLLSSLGGAAKYFYIYVYKIYFLQTPVRIFLSLFERSWLFFLIIFILVAYVWSQEHIKGKLRRPHYLSIVFLIITSFGSAAISRLLINLETKNYPNYLYSRFGLKPDMLELVHFTSLILIIISGLFIYGKSPRIKNKNLISRKPVKYALLTFAFLVLSWQSILSFSQAGSYINYSRQTYEDQFEHFVFIDVLEKIVPSESNVILPPQGTKWPALSNPPVVRYFLYPRTIISPDSINREVVSEIKSAYFVMLFRDEEVWPFINKQFKEVSFNGDEWIKYSSIELVYSDDGIIVYLINF